MTDTTTTAPDRPEAAAVSPVVLQRLVLPADADFDTLPLYAERGIVRPLPELEEGDDPHPPVQLEGNVHPDQVVGRNELIVTAGTRVSFATYFNAFPASYWRRWTRVSQVRLQVDVDGDADVVVYRTNARGDQNRVDKVAVTGGGTAVFELPLDKFGDGGWYWFDVVAGMSDVHVKGAVWSTDTAIEVPGRVSVGITTFNRTSDCVTLLAALAAQASVLDVIDTVFVVDQGTQKVKDDPGFPAVAATLGDLLQVVEQPNLGGSGGFSRSMFEATYHRDSRYVLLLDDDAVVEPEGILRAVAFADLARVPTIVGGHMLTMHAKATLHAYSERVNRYRFFWGPAARTAHNHDFAAYPLRSTRWLHRRVDADYNGWWMCLIPTDVVRRIGMALPVFIKWDDAEYSLRAAEHDVPTVSLPGAAVWHVSWADKDDSIDWQAYHHARNRLLAALLHSPYPRGGRVVWESMAAQIKHVLSMQYTTAELRLMALEDLLSGPDHLHATLPTKLAEIREFRKGQDDATIVTDPDGLPPVRRLKPPKRGKEPTEPRSATGRYVAAVMGVVRQGREAKPSSRRNPEAAIPAADSKWWLLSSFDSAVVSSADGSGAAWYRRDRDRFTAIVRRSAELHRELTRRWSSLADEYRRAAPELTSPKAWEPTWGSHEHR